MWATDIAAQINSHPVKEAMTSLVNFFNSFCTAALNSSIRSNLNHFNCSFTYPHSLSIGFTSGL